MQSYSNNIRVIDSMPIPVCEFGRTHFSKCFKGEASYGRCPSKKQTYFGFKFHALTTVDGFLTDYTMYQNMNTGEYVFVFGDKDIYRPEDGNFDWECETEEEAKEWFDNYVGFDDDLIDECWSSKLEEETETSPIVHKKSDGSYLVQSDSGNGYTAFNKDNVCQGHISASNEIEAKNKFNSNKFDE
jgi:hypothetical protein